MFPARGQLHLPCWIGGSPSRQWLCGTHPGKSWEWPPTASPPNGSQGLFTLTARVCIWAEGKLSIHPGFWRIHKHPHLFREANVIFLSVPLCVCAVFFVYCIFLAVVLNTGGQWFQS